MSEQEPQPIDADKLTWAVLLGRWVEFARSALALPTDAQGTRMRESVPDIIMLQAVWFSLEHLEDLAVDERRLGLDRAEVLIDKHEAQLSRRWDGDMPQALAELIADARQSLAKKK